MNDLLLPGAEDANALPPASGSGPSYTSCICQAAPAQWLTQADQGV